MFARSFVTEQGDVKRPKWWTVILPAGMAADFYKSKEKSDESDESDFISELRN